METGEKDRARSSKLKKGKLKEVVHILNNKSVCLDSEKLFMNSIKLNPEN